MNFHATVHTIRVEDPKLVEDLEAAGVEFVGVDGQLGCRAETAHLVDVEVKQLLDSAHQAAKSILTEHCQQLNIVAHELLKKETLNAAEFQALLKSDIASTLNE